jgi:predicted phage terminase large subunit-like protein
MVKLSKYDPRLLKQEMQRQLDMRKCQASLYHFVKTFWHLTSSEEFIPNWHIKEMCDQLQHTIQLVIDRKPKEGDLLVNVPPGSSKSTVFSRMAQPWAWTLDPTLQFITVSYAMPLALRLSVASRDIIRAPEYQHLFGDIFQIKADQDSKSFFKNDKGGFRIVGSTNTAITGDHAHVIIVDDPIDPKGVKSSVKMESVNHYVSQTLNSRKTDKAIAPTIMVMQRLGKGDPAGKMIQKQTTGEKKLVHLCLPATIDYPIKPAHFKDKYVDGLLDPIRLTRDTLAEEKADLRAAGYAGQYGQQPTNVEGNRFKKKWFGYANAWDLPKGIRWDLWLDGAYTKKTRNDPTGFMALGYYRPSNTLFVRHAQSQWLEMPELITEVKEYCVKVGISVDGYIYIEPKASGKSLRQLLRADAKVPWSAVEIESHLVQEGKVARAAMAEPKVASQNIVFVNGPWTEHCVDQLCAFTGEDGTGEHDEYVDLLGYASDHYFMQKQGSGVTQVN